MSSVSIRHTLEFEHLKSEVFAVKDNGNGCPIKTFALIMRYYYGAKYSDMLPRIGDRDRCSGQGKTMEIEGMDIFPGD